MKKHLLHSSNVFFIYLSFSIDKRQKGLKLGCADGKAVEDYT